MNPSRQAKTSKQPCKLTFDTRQFMSVKHTRAEAIAAVGIPRCQWITPLAVGCMKVTFEINRPNFVGTGGPAKGRPGPVRCAGAKAANVTSHADARAFPRC